MNAVSSIQGSFWSLHVKVDMIDITCGVPTASETWRYTDSNGHEHYYDHGYPTLVQIVDDEHWCNGDEGYEAHEPHLVIDAAHYDCVLCGETITPAVDPPFTPKSIPGTRTATIEGVRSDGLKVTAELTGDEIARLQADAMADDTALAILDALPMDRLTAFSMAR